MCVCVCVSVLGDVFDFFGTFFLFFSFGGNSFFYGNSYDRVATDLDDHSSASIRRVFVY